MTSEHSTAKKKERNQCKVSGTDLEYIQTQVTSWGQDKGHPGTGMHML